MAKAAKVLNNMKLLHFTVLQNDLRSSCKPVQVLLGKLI